MSIGGKHMEITVKLFATLREGRGKVVTLTVDNGISATDVLGHLEIALEDVTMLLINGRDKDPQTILQNGDVLSLFPPVGGG
jgi:molybdopterin converting factor small subunit